MTLQNKYVVGCLVMFYEIEMLWEYVDSIMGALTDVDNPENVHIVFDWNTQEYLETIDTDKLTREELTAKFEIQVSRLRAAGCSIEWTHWDNSSEFYNIAQHRRNLNALYCEKSDFILWGETDSLFPSETFHVIEAISPHADSIRVHRYIISFADRKNWDASWDVITHPMFEGVKYVDEKEWLITNEASSKSYMTIERMNDINRMAYEYDIRILKEPKFDGSCLVISTDLIKAGVNIPHAILHCGEDTSFGEMAKIVMGDNYTQFVIKNILRVHNRRHPRKRNYIRGENNPMGFVGMEKGAWWNILEGTSKHNLSILRDASQKFISKQEMMSEINENKHSS